jgi:hypothetical protein
VRRESSPHLGPPHRGRRLCLPELASRGRDHL